ncbi:hypothetical protein [Streptomyces sp. NPDC056061]|uniref:hypothetical protein n=1 Tax=Streptomyces sp. NPDC056061 TaxID=3345700 RepID=UPI0035E0E8C1
MVQPDWQSLLPRHALTGQEPAIPTGYVVALLTGHTGELAAVQLLGDRRGFRAWNLQGPKSAVALKANNPDGGDARDKAAETAQEDDHLLRLTPADTHIQAQPSADIWSLGASLFWCWTGHRPVAYDDDLDRLQKLAVIARAPPPRCPTSGRGRSPSSRTPSPRAWHPTPPTGPPRRS